MNCSKMLSLIIKIDHLTLMHFFSIILQKNNSVRLIFGCMKWLKYQVYYSVYKLYACNEKKMLALYFGRKKVANWQYLLDTAENSSNMC